ncbi:MAG TPA: hypothetical protein VG253_14855 [Streptosporangiaceae bacterium]|nr:hypothetical protein [Streptosporangiaceae bacterium]
MCSIADPGLARLGMAIDELAEQARANSAAITPRAAATSDGIAARLALAWALVADLDPAVAQRMLGYATTDD